MSRLHSILKENSEVTNETFEKFSCSFGLEITSEMTHSKYACKGLSCASCGNFILKIIIPQYEVEFGYLRGLPLDLAFTPCAFEERAGYLNLYRRCFLAEKRHINITCGCGQEKPIQLAKDEGLLIHNFLKSIQSPIPLNRVNLLSSVPKEWEKI